MFWIILTTYDSNLPFISSNLSNILIASLAFALLTGVVALGVAGAEDAGLLTLELVCEQDEDEEWITDEDEAVTVEEEETGNLHISEEEEVDFWVGTAGRRIWGYCNGKLENINRVMILI